MPAIRSASRASDGRFGEAQVARCAPLPSGMVGPDYFGEPPASSRDHVEIKMDGAKIADQGALPLVDQIVRLFIIVVDDSEDSKSLTMRNHVDGLHAVHRLEGFCQF